MDLLQLRYFYESARYENFSKTAEKYMVPVSSVSASVKRLEQELGRNLFDRSANRICLNEQGRILADSLRSAFECVEQTIADIQHIPEEKREIRLLVRAKRTMITDLLIEYKTSHPDISFRMNHDFDKTDFEAFDIVIDDQNLSYFLQEHISKEYSPWGASPWERFLLSIEHICIKACKSSHLAGRKLTMLQLRDEPFIMMGKASAMRRLLDETGKRCGFTPNVAIECDDRQCLLKCVEAGMGLALGSRSALNDESERNITALQVTDFNEIQAVYVYHRKLRIHDEVLTGFLDFLAQKAGNTHQSVII